VSPSASERLLLGGAAAPLTGWVVAAVDGRDRERFLHSQLSSDVRGLAEGSSQLTALLDRSARLVAFGFLAKRSDRIDLLAPAGAAGPALAALGSSVIADEVRIRILETPGLQLALGAEAVRRMGELPAGSVLPIAGWGSRGFVAWGIGELQLPPLDQAELEARRVLSGLPRWGVEAVAGRPVHETTLAAVAVSTTKGCYLGQETVAKVASGRGPARMPMLLEAAEGEAAPEGLVGRFFAVGGEPKAGQALSWARWEGRLYLQASLVRGLRVEGLEVEARWDDGTRLAATVRALPLLEPPAPEAWARRLQLAAVDAFAADREDEAVRLLERALAVCPGHADASESLGVILGRHGRYGEAIALMRRLLEIDPTSVMAHSNLSLFFNRLGRIEEAEQAAAEAARAAMLREKGARELEEEGRLRSAAAAEDRRRRAAMFREVLAIDRDDALANLGIGRVLVEEGRLGEAIDHLERALAADPRYSAAFLELGRAREAAGEREAAVDTYRRGIEVAAARGDLATASTMHERLAALTAPADA
jgi:folate-binding protein YgfZ